MQVTSSIQIADNTWPRSKPQEASILINQLEKLWKSCRTVKQHHDIKKSNEMLIKLLEIIIREKITKPDWRSIFVKHIHALSYSGKSKIAFYYFQIASQIFKEMTPSYLLKLLSKGPPLETHNTDEYLKFLKLDYRIVFSDSKDTSFAEKLMINICQFFVKDQDSSINPEEIFKHYMMCLAADDLALKLRLKKLALVAFQYQCYYCLKNIKKMSRIELNLYSILELLLNLYGSEAIQKQEYLYRSVSNFIPLMRTEILQNFILHHGKSIRVPQIVQKFIKLIDSLETQDCSTQRNSSNFFLPLGFRISFGMNLQDQEENINFNKTNTSSLNKSIET